MLEIKKNNHSFFVVGKYSEEWFLNKYKIWENDTFHILEYYKNYKKSIYLDIGAWIGPTVLYSANIYNKVIAVEPDTVAIDRLKKNISINNYDNIFLVEKGLSNCNEKKKFGGNGNLGNSRSSLLVSHNEYKKKDSLNSNVNHDNDIIEIETITINNLLKEQKINPEDLSLIKIDIEGGEIIVIPAIEIFLQKYKPVLFISLHYCFLEDKYIYTILDILFKIYDKCFHFNCIGKKIPIDINNAKNNKLTSLVFE